MKKINKKKLIILIIILIAVIFEILAFRNSRAQKVFNITAEVVDFNSFVQNENITLSVEDGGSSGYYITLPEYIGTKKVDAYIAEKHNIHEISEEETNVEVSNSVENEINEQNIVDSENTTIEEIIDNTIQEENNIEENDTEETTETYLLPGQVLYLTDEEIENENLQLMVQYNFCDSNGQKLYEQKIETQIDDNEDGIIDNTIKIEGLIPLEASINASRVGMDDIGDVIKEVLDNKKTVKTAYDIKIIYNDTQYEPTDFDTNVKVTITGIETIDKTKQNYEVVHIDDEKTYVTEVGGVQVSNDAISFPASSFSTYAVLLADTAATYSLDTSGASVWDGSNASSFRFGSGTQAAPYLITNAEELSYFATSVNNGNSYEGQYIALIADIDLNGLEWTPIGDYNNSFKGVFDGLGHTITNTNIQLPSSIPTSVTTYGFFGSIGGGGSKTIVKNVQLDNFTININTSGTTANTQRAKGYNIGIVTGTMFSNSEVKNVIVDEGNITDSYTMTLRNYYSQVFVGGIAGYAVYSTSSTSDPGTGNRYSIENCYADVDMDLSIAARQNNYANVGQYAAGGIIGGIRSQPVWPKNCLYTGNINATNAFIGPIFGWLRSNTTANNTNNFATLWNGYDAGSTRMTAESYFTSYSARGRNFSTSVTSGTSNQRYSTNNYMGRVQGVNKGIYTNNLNTMLNNFNNYVTNNSSEEYSTWYLDSSSNTYYFEPDLSGYVEKDSPNYTIIVNDRASTGSYTYEWYINGSLDSNITGDTTTLESNWTENYKVEVLISNGISYAMVSFEVPLLEIHVSFEMNNNTNTLTAGLEGTGTADPNFNLSDYTYKWYKLDIAESEQELEGQTTNVITDLENGMDYKVIATNERYSYMSTEGIYTYGNRTVIYVDPDYGSDYNDGFTPNTAVETMETAYGKFNSSTTRDENVIVLMNDYSDTGFLDSATSTTFRKNVTITGKYKGTDYAPSLNFEGYNNGYKYLNGNTTFMHLAFDGSYSSWWGGGSNSQTYFYLQGYSLTMGEGIVMENYSTANTNQGLITGNAPAFHIFAGWLQYDETSLPRTDAKIVIKSGTYGRILLGGSSGNSDVSSITKNNSHNFMGTSLTDDLYKAEITIDIQNSTTSSTYAYDINLLGGGSTCGNIYGDIKINIKNGSIGRLLGASIGDSSYRPNNWNYPLNTFIGTATINMTGGSVTEMYGGCLGRNMTAMGGNDTNPIACDSYFYGTVNINISGGTVSQTIYGAGAGGVSGYSENSTDAYKSYGQNIDTVVNINISGGTIDADIYGGGYGYTNYLTANSTQTDGGTLYGSSNINISGSPTINGSIYGGGRGYNLASNKPDLAQTEGNSVITISGTPSITGNIYGAGMGLSQYENMAKFTGTVNVNVEADLSTNVFGGGNIAKTIGTTNININSGTHTADIYGGGNVGILEGTTNVTINGGTSSDVYGGGKSADVTNSNVYIKGGETTNVYGGGNQAGSESTYIEITGGTTTAVYGGSNQSGTVNATTINANNGTVVDIFGGNNEGGTCPETNVTINGSSVTDAVYGGGNQVATENTKVTLNNSGNETPYIFGGGKSADATNTSVIINGGTATSVFGGSNKSGTVTTSNVEMYGGTMGNVYGGNNAGGTTVTSNVIINDGTTNNVFGGGNQANTTTSNVTINNGKMTNVFGGANQADVTTTYVTVKGGNIENAFGGSNQSGTVNESNVSLESNASAPSGGIKMEVDYTAVEAEQWRKDQNPGYETYITVNIKYTNNTDTTIDSWTSFIQASGSKLLDNYSSDSLITEDNGKYTINQDSRWTAGTIHSLPANGTYEISDVHLMSSVSPSEFGLTYNFEGQGNDGNSYQDTNTGFTIFGGNNKGGQTTTSNINIKSGYAYAVYGGNNEGGQNITSNVNINGGEIKEVYGGNNLGGTNTTSNVTINDGAVTDVYGGGNQAVTNTPSVTVQNNANIEGSVYGGGNQAGIETNTEVEILGGTIAGNVYGGGNEGTVAGNTYVHVKDATLLDSVYAGGNGTTAVVLGNANITIEGTTTNITNSVFGGGNQAATGTEANNNSTSTVNIVGGNIGKNVYGGANTSVVYGYTKVNIGYDAVADNTLTIGDIVIGGTIFGGGEANASGSEVYDFSFISVTKGIDMNINGQGHDKCQFKGSIFGSGNASSTSGYSYINIKNYGSVYSPQSNISIQRANIVTLDNSAMSLSGATDRTNEYSSVYFTLSRIDELKLKNGSILYLNYGANLLKKLTSCVDENGQEVKAQVTIDADTGETTRNVDNRIYMAEGKNLNIATNEQVTAYGEVSGMTFFGLFTNTKNPSTSTGIYNREYNNGDEITNAGTFVSNSYVLGQHMTNHDTTVDGFYSNYEEEDNPGYIRTKYIETTPEDDTYYIWLVGAEVDVTTFEISLTGSKYATLGTYELALTGFATPNTKFVLSGFSAGLADGISLINPADIENISADPDTANEVFGLSMKTGNNGWQTNSSTYFLTENGGKYVGPSEYNSDNSSYTPALNFCFYHSGNISLAQSLGSVKVRFQALVPIDDLNYDVLYIDINITLLTALYQNDFFEAAITPGEEFSLFTTTETNITDSSVFSTYYSLYIPDFSESKYYENYNQYNRVIVSRDSSNSPYVFPENTKITMIDMVTNKYYYYVVTNQDETNNKYVYRLSDFVAMGSDSSNYDEAANCVSYYNADQDLIYENYIFHIDFSENVIPEQKIGNSLLMELRDTENQTLIGVLGIQRDSTIYSVYKDKDAIISLSASLSDSVLYRGNKVVLTATTDFTQEIISSKTIYDTHYFDQKMGIKISIYDNNGNRLNSDSLLGVSFTLNGTTYYPRIDGTVRIKIADKISNVLSKITIDTSQNTTLATGDYTIKVESFGSPDGIYYGIEPSDTVEIPIRIIDSTYGLKVYTDDKTKIVDKTTGKTEYGNNALWINMEYSAALSNPNITISLYRRDYSEVYSQDYNLVDFADYVSTNLQTSHKEKEYLLTDNPQATIQNYFALKENLTSGTYKIVYKLYDEKSYIGEAYEYVVIK